MQLLLSVCPRARHCCQNQVCIIISPFLSESLFAIAQQPLTDQDWHGGTMDRKGKLKGQNLWMLCLLCCKYWVEFAEEEEAAQGGRQEPVRQGGRLRQEDGRGSTRSTRWATRSTRTQPSA